MTDDQFAKWENTAIRIATHCVKGSEERKRKVLEEVKNYFYWRHFQKDWSLIQDWEGNNDDYHLGSSINEFFDEHYHANCWNGGKFFNQIVGCIQAAFGMTVKRSLGGVIGYTAGDIRKMWEGIVPDWVKESLRDVYVSNESLRDAQVSFDSIPDSSGLWL